MSHRSTLRRGRTAVVAGLIATAALGLTACNGTGGSDAARPRPSPPRPRLPGRQHRLPGLRRHHRRVGRCVHRLRARHRRYGRQRRTRRPQGQSGDRLGHCTTDGLQAGWGSEGGGVPDMKSDQQQTAAVWLKNISGTPCSISGFPGVQIKGTDGTTWDLQRSAKKPESKVLKPNAHTTFTLALLPSTRADDKKVEPGQVLITPPNEKKHFQLQWPFGGAILDQSGATHPGTFVNPVNVP
ncbi:DUF4232 domain-containing protein [Streptomyces noursei]|nr:DUF4232 domain-containing protein [Streptomyces noursei]